MSLSKIKTFFTKYWQWPAISALAVIFFVSTAYFINLSQAGNFIKWGSPDETANYTFTKLYAQEGDLRIFEKYNLYAEDIIHPRSFRSDFGKLKPVSFLGIILIYGQLAKFFSYKIIPYLTPIIGGIGIIFFYLLIKKIFGKRNALISTFLLAAFPPFLYYSARSMFHNVLFTVLILIGLYFSVCMNQRKSKAQPSNSFTLRGLYKYSAWIYSALAGAFFGLAIITRISELIWILPMLLGLWIFNIRKIGIYKLIIFLSFLFLSWLPAMYWNKILYGSFFQGGYPEMNQSISSIASAGSDLIKGTAMGELAYHKELLKKVKENIFYFGFHPRQSFWMFYYYFIKMFKLLFWMSLFGFVIFLFRAKKLKKKQIIYSSILFLISIILVFYYGSWEFHDNPDPESYTIGNSYTRYWLPIYLGVIPFAGIFIIRITKLFRKKIFIASSRIAIIFLYALISLNFLMVGSEEGLMFSYAKHRQAKIEYQRVLELTENNSVIITFYHDKLFFPERKVIPGLFNDKNMVDKYAVLAGYLPVYYYNFSLGESDIKYLNEKRLFESGLNIEKVKKITPDFTLYKLYPIK